MRILSNQQVNYCNLNRQTEQGLEHLPGVSYEGRLYIIHTFFPLEKKQEALFQLPPIAGLHPASSNL